VLGHNDLLNNFASLSKNPLFFTDAPEYPRITQIVSKIMKSPNMCSFANHDTDRTITNGNRIANVRGANHHLKCEGSVVSKAAFKIEVT